MVSIVYGINQGMGEAFFGVATEYFLSDLPPKGLGVQPSKMTSIDGFANIPWQVKSLYGIASDTFPVGGLHRSPYIIFSAAVGVFSWSFLWLFPVLTAGITALALFFGNFSIASPDVMVDASVAERCKTHPRLASDLQTLCWASFGIGKLVSGLMSGYLYDTLGSRMLFGFTAVTSMVTLYPAMQGWLCEETKPPNDAGRTGCRSLVDAFEDPVSGPLYRLSVILLAMSITMGIGANVVQGGLPILALSLPITLLVPICIFYFEKGVSKRLAKASAFIFLSQAVQPSSPVLFYWSRDNDQNCGGQYGDRPCFSPEFFSVVSTVGNIVFIVGTTLYNKYFSSWSYKKIWASTQIAMCALGVLDFILVMRLNKIVGVSDHFFVIGSEIVQDLIKRVNTMPLFVLAAATCPDGVEATLFAMNMGISNFGGSMSGYFGIVVMWMLGDVKAPEFVNIESFVVIRSLARLLPLLFIPFLCPDGSPNSEGETEVEFAAVTLEEDINDI